MKFIRPVAPIRQTREIGFHWESILHAALRLPGHERILGQTLMGACGVVDHVIVGVDFCMPLDDNPRIPRDAALGWERFSEEAILSML